MVPLHLYQTGFISDRSRRAGEQKDAAPALPVDGLLEEMRGVLKDARSWCPKDSGAAADIDALLARMGGGK